MPSHQPRPRPAAAVAILGAEAVARALRRRRLRVAGRMRVAAQRMADENHVVARRRQRAVGLVGDADRMQRSPAVERERRRQIQKLRLDRADRARGRLRGSAWPSARSYPRLRQARAPLYDPGLRRAHRLQRKGSPMAMTSVNNGVNVQALLDAREALKGAPDAAKFTWRASCKWQNGTHSNTKVQRLLRARPGAAAQDRDLVRGRSPGDLRLGGSSASPRSSTCSSAWPAA